MKLRDPRRNPIPRVYEICGICGLDHDHDIPNLSEAAVSAAVERHLEKSAFLPEDLMTAQRPRL